MICTLCDICESNKEHLTIEIYGKALLPLCLKCYQNPDRAAKLVEKLAENRNSRDEARRIIAKLDEENERLKNVILKEISCKNCKHHPLSCVTTVGLCTDFCEKWEAKQ